MPTAGTTSLREIPTTRRPKTVMATASPAKADQRPQEPASDRSGSQAFIELLADVPLHQEGHEIPHRARRETLVRLPNCGGDPVRIERRVSSRQACHDLTDRSLFAELAHRPILTQCSPARGQTR